MNCAATLVTYLFAIYNMLAACSNLSTDVVHITLLDSAVQH